ncbi:SIS domain-containing protein [Xylariaceae sp. FL0662B]|nr:SIS domain-containing protein [Xylariaceae sp. FL0662B]
MVEHHPVHNSEVYLLGIASRPSVPPPSPPSPITPTDNGPSNAIEELCLDDAGGLEDRFEARPLFRQRISGALHVLNTEATALWNLTQMYKTDVAAAESFNTAVEVIARHGGNKGKLVIIGVGKSGHIGKKMVATFNSLGVHSTFLHPTEALHGDLGKIGEHDTLLFITFSGKTPELLALLPHINMTLPAIVLTSHLQPDQCELIRRRPSAILLSAPIHESEIVSFGVSAPTTSTTVALAMGDALAVVVSKELHSTVNSVFAKNHPGGAIGAKAGKISDLAVPLCEIPAWSSSNEACGADILKLGYDSPSGWVRVGDAVVSPSRIRQLDTAHLVRRLSDILGLVVERSEWVNICADTRIAQASEWIRDPLMSPEYGESACNEDSILAVVENGEVVGVLEAGQLFGWQE